MLTQVYYRTVHAQKFLQNNFCNLMLLDVTLPDQDGFSFLENLRRNEIAVPTIFLTGNDSEASKAKGLEIGADDYVTKPFSATELVARINAVHRRAKSAGDNNVTKNVRVMDQPFPFAGVEVNPNSITINFSNGDSGKIGRKELGILDYLNSNPNSIITRKNLIHSVWGLHANIRSRSLDQYIVKIREIFNRKGMPLQSLRTIHGIGYEFDPNKTISVARPAGVSQDL
jgi:DNA-binding response OmpR family regulator